MTPAPNDSHDAEQVEKILDTPDLADALESEQFRKFLDHVPIAVAVSELGQREVIVYVNPEWEAATGLPAATFEGRSWELLHASRVDAPSTGSLAHEIVEGHDWLGSFELQRPDGPPKVVDVHANVIQDDHGAPSYRLVALVSAGSAASQTLEVRLHEKDTLLRELQHRVKNNLQMITALIRLETRNGASTEQGAFERLAGRVGSLAILYDALSIDGRNDEVDLGVYVSQIATAVMASHAVEGIHLDLQVDTYPVSINVAMPTGLVVNELLTNALKHAFGGRDGGTITLHCLVDERGCKILIADDGIGLPPGESWPKRGKLGALIAQSLRENARAELEMQSSPETGTAVTITFERWAAEP